MKIQKQKVILRLHLCKKLEIKLLLHIRMLMICETNGMHLFKIQLITKNNLYV